jgi:type IV pilus assembly protein PilQ
MFKFFETEQLGEIIASPNVSVRDRQKGRIQVGSDFSIKQRDFAGNIIENFFSTGSIIEVTPYVYKEDGLDYILLNIKVERSSFIPDAVTTEIRKTTASTQALMLNGEETVIGGLYINDETKVRRGIPFLKDLPWWVFGIRYLTGSDETIINKKELVILIKTELVPTLKERISGTQSTTPIKDEVNKYRENIKYYRFNKSTEN